MSLIPVKNHQVHQRAYFPRSEFHCRYSSYFVMDKPSYYNTYHRSNFKGIEGATQKAFKFLGNNKDEVNGMYPKIGNFFNTYAFPAYKKALKPIKTLESEQEAYWYDLLLERQKRMAQHVVTKVKERKLAIPINSDNAYTCVLFSLPKPAAEKNVKVWTQLISVYLIALTNKLADERGINMEMVRRSSFGSLRPSIAECGESVRVNLGLCPQAYADCVIDAICYLKKIFENTQAFDIPFVSAQLTKALNSYNKAKSTTKKQVKIELKGTLWATLWAPGDSSNRSFATQIFRKPVVVEKFIDLITQGLEDTPLNTLFEDEMAFKKAFVTPLENILKTMHFDNKKKVLSMDVEFNELKVHQWTDPAPVIDSEFWSIVESLAKRLGATSARRETIVGEKSTENLHSTFEELLANFIFQPLQNNEVEDGCGSDSECEDELEINGEMQTVYAKKMITATCMRAIQLVYAVSRNYLNTCYKVDPLDLNFKAEKMYYETEEALKKHALPLNMTEYKSKKRTQSTICFFDVNHCNATQDKNTDYLDLIEMNDRICVIDITSATTKEIRNVLVTLYEHRPKLELIIGVSSGLKNEQAMGDYNPYGTVRIFAKTSDSLESVYSDLLSLEQQGNYTHPKESHLIRKTAKIASFAPTNSAILSSNGLQN